LNQIPGRHDQGPNARAIPSGAHAITATEEKEAIMSKLLSRTLIAGIATAALAGGVWVSHPGAAQAYQCKTVNVQAEAIHQNAATSLASAKNFWSGKAKNSYGLAWSVWNIASGKTQNCNHTGAAYYCIVRAKPCLYVVP
jgi:hypothetical protein